MRVAVVYTLLAFTVMVTSVSAYASSFRHWLDELDEEVLRQGVSEQTWQQVKPELVYLPKVVALDKKQPEWTKSFSQYLATIVNTKRVMDGRHQYGQHKSLLKQTADKYNVPPQYILALWGIETNFGNNTGGFAVPSALATLAYDGRRRSFFTNELIAALKIIDQEHIAFKDMRGSWAGAMGQTQFMPTSFLGYAVDANHNGKKNIWDEKADIFGSIANYLSSHGWDQSQGWGLEVDAPSKPSRSLLEEKSFRPRNYWVNAGYKAINGDAIPEFYDKLRIVRPGKDDERYFLVSKNYDVILDWNRSTYFATSVGMLADAIAKTM